jgi:hypothetical protein
VPFCELSYTAISSANLKINHHFSLCLRDDDERRLVERLALH